MDYPLGVMIVASGSALLGVLIPILMDYPLGANNQLCYNCGRVVLIPILMDYLLGGNSFWLRADKGQRS